MNDTRARSAFARDLDARRARDWARLALLLAACAAFTVVAGAGSDGWLVLLSGVGGLSLAGAGLWWALAHRGWTRLLGALLAVLVPFGVLALYASSGLWIVAVSAIALWTAALASARSALRSVRQPHAKRRRRGRKTPPPSRPVFIMNPRSGGGKVERFDLARRAEALGARVILIAPDGTTDPEAEALRALFGPYGVPVTAPKTMTGRLYAGGGALDLAWAFMALREGVIPPTVHTADVPAHYQLDLVVARPRRTRLRTALVLARGYGGFNAAMVLRAAEA
nr:hypothetical protein [Streptomyces acidiscabies]